MSLRNKNDHINTLHPAIIQHTIILKIIAVLHSMFLNSMVFTNDMVSMQCRCATCSDKRISDLGGWWQVGRNGKFTRTWTHRWGPFWASRSANPMENVAHGHCRTVFGHKIVTLFCAMSMWLVEECLAKDRVMSANGDFQDFKKKAMLGIRGRNHPESLCNGISCKSNWRVKHTHLKN